MTVRGQKPRILGARVQLVYVPERCTCGAYGVAMYCTCPPTQVYRDPGVASPSTKETETT